ncbi:MAG: hypothetical protein Q4D91_12835 [Lautropia sp.]|nr:hypothetical protein [Lautropia sp.]
MGKKRKQDKYAYQQAMQQPMPPGAGWQEDNAWNPHYQQQPWMEAGNAYGVPPGAYPGYPGTAYGMPPGNPYGATPGTPYPGAPFPGAGQAQGFGAPHGAGVLGWLGNRQMEQFILGLILGGAAAYVLGDPEKRARLIRMGMKLYAGVAGSVEEFKEQIADLKAEVAAEQGTDFED